MLTIQLLGYPIYGYLWNETNDLDPKLWTKFTHGSLDVRPCASASVQIDRTFTKLANGRPLTGQRFPVGGSRFWCV
jgi:hypothetical protein